MRGYHITKSMKETIQDIYDEYLDYKIIVDGELSKRGKSEAIKDVEFALEMGTLKGMVCAMAIVNKNYDIKTVLGDDADEVLDLADGWFPTL
ncbi:MAG TPA: hypothetical protein DCW90_02675 [Lachnospiraceae bacterium]|nr:hypothetical protein [Lachnospiraceae bacterium]